MRERKRKWALFLWLGFLAAGMMCCLFFLFLPNRVYEIGGEVSLTGQAPVDDLTIYDEIALPKGVYQVKVAYHTDQDHNGHIGIWDGTVFYGGLKTNGENVFAKGTQTTFLMWLLEDTEHLQVTANYSGEGILEFTGVTFVETNQLWTMVLTVLVFVSIFSVCLVYYGNRIHPGLNREQKIVVFGILGITLLSSYFPLSGEAVNGIDLIFHYLRIEGVKDGLLSGQIPVRIEPQWLFGQGFACAIFYCDFLLLVPALFRLLGFTIVTSCNLFFILLNFATAMISYHCFQRIFKSRMVGLVCSALYTLSTYRIYKLFQTGDFGDGTALTFYPLILYGYYEVFTGEEKKKGNRAWLALAIGYAGLMQTHILTCEITLALTILLCLIQIKKIRKPWIFWQLCKGASLAFALGLWYVVPFLDYYFTQDMHIKNLTARTIQYKGLTPAHLFFHFWHRGSNIPQGNNGAQFTYPVGVGLVLMIGLFVFLALWGRLDKEEKKTPIFAFGRLTAVLAAMLLCMSLNLFPWDRIQHKVPLFVQPISSLEFPSRVLGWGTAFLICVYGVLLRYFEKEEKEKYYALGIILVFISVFTSTAYLSEQVLNQAGTLVIYNPEGMGSGFVSDGEFVLEGTKPAELTVETLVWSEQMQVDFYEKQYLSAKVTCQNQTRETGFLDFPLVSYRDYQAKTANGEKLQVTHNDRFQVRVEIPAGFSGELQVKFVPPFYWRVSEIISLVAYVGLAGWGIKVLLFAGRGKE